jgi:hypothetical protein
MGKSWEKCETIYCEDGEREHDLEGSQASPSRPSGKDSVKVKMLGWSEAVAWDRGRGVSVFWIDGELLYNLVAFTTGGGGLTLMNLNEAAPLLRTAVKESLMLATATVSETSGTNSALTRLIALEDFTVYCRCESFNSCKFHFNFVLRTSHLRNTRCKETADETVTYSVGT